MSENKDDEGYDGHRQNGLEVHVCLLTIFCDDQIHRNRLRVNDYTTIMKYTFTANYLDVNRFGQGQQNPMEITLWIPIHETHGMARIHDKSIEKTIVCSWEPRTLTVHRKFKIANGNSVYTLEQVKAQQTAGQNYGVMEDFPGKEIIIGIADRQLIVDSGTFDRIVSAFKFFPDEVEELLMF